MLSYLQWNSFYIVLVLNRTFALMHCTDIEIFYIFRSLPCKEIVSVQIKKGLADNKMGSGAFKFHSIAHPINEGYLVRCTRTLKSSPRTLLLQGLYHV